MRTVTVLTGCTLSIFRTVLSILPASMFFHFVTCMIGLAVFAYFARSGCDPLAINDIDNPNQVGHQ